ncbi:MAG: 50S ribosomal protein L4 [Candidatus Aminicenantales bacterium]
MAKIGVVDRTGKTKSEMSLPGNVFSYPVKEHLLYEAVLNQRANMRTGTASTKTRSEVRGGGRKPWRQKGTGRARAGSIRSPLWRKGGTTFGPKPRDYSYSLPKKAKKNALKSALSLKHKEKLILILEDLKLKEPKTKEGVKLLENLKIDSALFIDTRDNRNLFLSLRNIRGVKTVDFKDVNTYDVLKYRWLVFSKNAFESLMERLK